MNSKNILNRRQALGGMGLGLTSLLSAPVLAGTVLGINNESSPTALEDPTSKYPKPPFKPQSQPWPGFASQMDPKPDHGETSYKGSGRLMGRKAQITGGDSGMARAAAIAFAREGADVAINDLPAEGGCKRSTFIY